MQAHFVGHPLLPANTPRTPAAAAIRIDELDGTERLVVQAMRGLRRDDAVDELSAVDSPTGARDDAGQLQHAIAHYCAAVPPATMAGAVMPADQLGSLEAQTLRALACLQSGLLGEAWRALAEVCGREQAGRALLSLQEVAGVLQLRDQRIERWRFDPAYFRAAGLI